MLLGAGFGQKHGAYYRRPISLIRADRPQEASAALDALDRAVAAGRHAAGYFAYELGYVLEPRLAALLPAERPAPLLHFGIFEQAEPPPDLGQRLATPPRALAPTMTARAYEARVARILALIAAGDVYQVNLTYGLDFELEDPLALYGALHAHQPVSYPAIVDLGGPLILSLSPELFFKIDAGRITARPMKGTAPRARLSDADAAAARALAGDPKNRAENLMITDLLRNDLSKIAAPGSVCVPALYTVETYRTLHTLTSSIEAELQSGSTPSQIVRALFPCGSVTGAPKIRAMEIIRELEPEPRGIYTGAIGVFRGDGSACFNVAIRTLAVEGSRARLGIGGGIVADSEPAAEAEEARLKARFLTGLSPYAADQAALGLIETLRYAPSTGLLRLERHLARLAASAAYFSIPVDLAAIRRGLIEHVRGAAEARRVRLVLAEDEELKITSQPFDVPNAPWRCRLSTQHIISGDVLRAHKTTRRGLYEEEYARASAEGFDEVLFLNERGEIAEGSRTNVFLERDSVLLTPPVEAGALPGCLRAELLEEGRAREATLAPADLTRGTLFLGNSLRGLMACDLTQSTGG